MVNKELQKVVSLKTFSNFDKKFSDSKIFWLGDLHTTPTKPLLFCIETSQIMLSLKLKDLTTEMLTNHLEYDY